MVEDDDAVAGLEAGDGRTRFGHDAGGFVAEDARRGEQVIFDFLEIGVADPAASTRIRISPAPMAGVSTVSIETTELPR